MAPFFSLAFVGGWGDVFKIKPKMGESRSPVVSLRGALLQDEAGHPTSL